MSAEVQFEEKTACDVCGKFGAFAFDGRKLCTDCYESFGSCCPEFGREEQATDKRDE
jgi:hypothetical protein